MSSLCCVVLALDLLCSSFSFMGSIQRWAKLLLKPTLVTLVWALSSVFSGLDRAGTRTLKTAFELDGALYYLKEKLSNRRKKNPFTICN